jgi:hypothetical protein
VRSPHQDPRRSVPARQLKPWHVNLGRQIKSTKTYIVDRGLLAHLIAADETLIVGGGAVAGSLLESFAAMELLRQATWADHPVDLFHYRDKQQREVDIVIKRDDGDVVAIEVKASGTLPAKDFARLSHLRDALGVASRPASSCTPAPTPCRSVTACGGPDQQTLGIEAERAAAVRGERTLGRISQGRASGSACALTHASAELSRAAAAVARYPPPLQSV